MSDTRFDCLIAGGGPVGWAAALAARLALGGSARVAVVERQPIVAPTAQAPLAPRVYTLAQRVLQWLEASGVTLDPARCATVRSIVVHGLDRVETLRTGSRDASVEALAWVIEHDALTAQLAQRAQALGVQLIEGEVQALHGIEGDQRLLELTDRRLLGTRLLIVADGVRSRLRQLGGIEAELHPYRQHGVVAHFTAQQAHCGAARQWFLPDGGILALLPLPDQQGAPACSMVWSAPPEQAAQLTRLDEVTLIERINDVVAADARVERVLSPAQAFPLNLVKVRDPVAERLLVMGDAAHAMHPLAGQGVNLGLADARDLQHSLGRAPQVGGDPGHPLLLAHYRRARHGATLAMQSVTDALYHLYNLAPGGPLPRGADLGLRLLSRLSPFRRSLATAALGN